MAQQIRRCLPTLCVIGSSPCVVCGGVKQMPVPLRSAQRACHTLWAHVESLESVEPSTMSSQRMDDADSVRVWVIFRTGLITRSSQEGGGRRARGCAERQAETQHPLPHSSLGDGSRELAVGPPR